MADQGVAPGGTGRNLDSLEGIVEWAPAITDSDRLLLADPQTSGGLLMAVPPDRLDELQSQLGDSGVYTAAVIGEIAEPAGPGGPAVHVVP